MLAYGNFLCVLFAYGECSTMKLKLTDKTNPKLICTSVNLM